MNRTRKDRKRGLIVYVDEQLRHSKRFDVEGMQRDYPHLFTSFRESGTPGTSHQCFNVDEGQLRFWTSDMCTLSPTLFDLVLTLGGDGTVLFASWLFQSSVPPVIPFSLGSLGFLTPFCFDDYPSVLDSAITNGIRLNMRMRFRATVYRAIDTPNSKPRSRRRKAPKPDSADSILQEVKECGWYCVEMEPGADAPEDAPLFHDEHVHLFRTRPVESFEFLNDLVVDRGPSPYVTMLEVFADDMHLTTAQADGLCISTPTGSTAYSLSAGGSLVHPFIPAMLITPICPHTLSFRPMLVPDSMDLRIAVPHNSRSNAWASFDGRGRIEICRGDHIKITASPYPFPTVTPENETGTWFHSVSRTFNWNQRKHQMGFMVYDGHPNRKQSRGNPQTQNSASSRGTSRSGNRVKDKFWREENASDLVHDAGEQFGDDDADDDHDDDHYDDDEDDNEVFDIDEATPENLSRLSGSWSQSAFPTLPATSTFSQDNLSFGPSSKGEPVPIHYPTNELQETKWRCIRSPDRFGPGGPPPAPGPLSERHLATMDFRLRSKLDDRAARK